MFICPDRRLFENIIRFLIILGYNRIDKYLGKEGDILKRVTLKEIAKKFGVSPSTVSRALSGKPGVSKRLREKILKAAEEMG
ncbi:helix-turn-helix domain-containing protein, partial [Thermotoga sp.]|uniref:helix-turn-helix domain-containing protein n=1 Tax=Thermotoga sp. TaxID=28240 RepID=UPI0026008018